MSNLEFKKKKKTWLDAFKKALWASHKPNYQIYESTEK